MKFKKKGDIFAGNVWWWCVVAAMLCDCAFPLCGNCFYSGWHDAFCGYYMPSLLSVTYYIGVVDFCPPFEMRFKRGQKSRQSYIIIEFLPKPMIARRHIWVRWTTFKKTLVELATFKSMAMAQETMNPNQRCPMNPECRTCGKTFTTARGLSIHVSKVHKVYDMYGGGPSSDSVAGNGYTTCEYCGQAFDNQFYVSPRRIYHECWDQILAAVKSCQEAGGFWVSMCTSVKCVWQPCDNVVVFIATVVQHFPQRCDNVLTTLPHKY